VRKKKGFAGFATVMDKYLKVFFIGIKSKGMVEIFSKMEVILKVFIMMIRRMDRGFLLGLMGCYCIRAIGIMANFKIDFDFHFMIIIIFLNWIEFILF
jgi:hypothetical protein